MKALDLFCGAGGATKGLQRAGFHVTGVDINRQPNYCGDEFLQGDALECLRGMISSGYRFDLIWASPPCQRYMTGGNVRDRDHRPDLIRPVRSLLIDARATYIIENVPGAPIRVDAMLCGTQFGLALRRHRHFETWFRAPLPAPCDHSSPVVGVYGHPHGEAGAWKGMLAGTLKNWREAMGIDWMTATELSQAIPPVYSEFLAQAFLNTKKTDPESMKENRDEQSKR